MRDYDDKLLASGHPYSLLLHKRAPDTSLASTLQSTTIEEEYGNAIVWIRRKITFTIETTYLIQTSYLSQKITGRNIFILERFNHSVVFQKWDCSIFLECRTGFSLTQST